MIIDKSCVDYSLCLVTDRNLMSTKTLEEAVEQAIQGGATTIQIREKDIASVKFYDIAISVKNITDAYNIPLIINDRVDVALAVDAAGIHIGQSDLPASVVRKIIPDSMILGVSATNVSEAIQAQKDGADYIGVGAMFITSTKDNAKIVTMDELKEIRKSVDIPIMLIGGIDETNVSSFSGTGIDGLAIVSSIISKPDIKEAAINLLSEFKKHCK